VYTVTAVSKDGLASSASIGYTVTPAPPSDRDEPPNGRGDPPNGPKEPPLKVALSLSVERESLRELLRTRKLVVAARVNEAAKVALTGRAKLEADARRKAATKAVAVFKKETVRFVDPGEKKVTLVLSREGLGALRRLSKLRLSIVGKATDPVGETATRRMALTLQR
jgi:hypothetical protein